MSTNPIPTPTLESVQAEFAHWRENKSSPRARIPDDLKQKAVALLRDMSAGKLKQALGVNSTMLKAWAGQETQSGSTKPTVEFVTLPVAPERFADADVGLKLDFTQPNGNHWCLQGNISASQLNAFIIALSRLPGGIQ